MFLAPILVLFNLNSNDKGSFILYPCVLTLDIGLFSMLWY